MSLFTGAGVAIITPFSADGSVDYPSLKSLIDFQIENGTDCIVITGTSGEASTLTEQEHIDVIRAAVEYTAKRVPVMAGTGSNCTATAVALSRAAEEAGADAVLQVSPYYNKATQRGLYEHFADVAHSISIPVVLYNIQGRTGVNIQPQTIAQLFADVPNIIGVKEASGNISQIADIMQLTDGRIELWSGNDDQIVPILSLGGHGVVSVLSNIAPRQTHDIVAKFMAGDVEGSRKLQLDFLPLIHALFSEVNPIPVKKACSVMGFCQGAVRKPLTVMEDAHAAVLVNEMKKMGLLG